MLFKCLNDARLGLTKKPGAKFFLQHGMLATSEVWWRNVQVRLNQKQICCLQQSLLWVSFTTTICHETPKVNVWRQWANAFYPRSKTQQGRFAVQFSLCHMPYHQDKESRKRQKKNQCLRLNNQDGRYSAASGCSMVGDVFFCFSMQYFSIWIICPGHLAVSLYITHITSYKTHIYVYIKYILYLSITYHLVLNTYKSLQLLWKWKTFLLWISLRLSYLQLPVDHGQITVFVRYLAAAPGGQDILQEKLLWCQLCENMKQYLTWIPQFLGLLCTVAPLWGWAAYKGTLTVSSAWGRSKEPKWLVNLAQ